MASCDVCYTSFVGYRWFRPETVSVWRMIIVDNGILQRVEDRDQWRHNDQLVFPP